MEFFIIADGVLLDRIVNMLAQKAENGADVRIIYDDFIFVGKITAARISGFAVYYNNFSMVAVILGCKDYLRRFGQPSSIFR